jgi:hypothetical protein
MASMAISTPLVEKRHELAGGLGKAGLKALFVVECLGSV